MFTHYGAARTGRRPPCAQLPVRDGAALDPPGEASAPSPGPPPRSKTQDDIHGSMACQPRPSLRERRSDRDLPTRGTSRAIFLSARLTAQLSAHGRSRDPHPNRDGLVARSQERGHCPSRAQHTGRPAGVCRSAVPRTRPGDARGTAEQQPPTQRGVDPKHGRRSSHAR